MAITDSSQGASSEEFLVLPGQLVVSGADSPRTLGREPLLTSVFSVVYTASEAYVITVSVGSLADRELFCPVGGAP